MYGASTSDAFNMGDTDVSTLTSTSGSIIFNSAITHPNYNGLNITAPNVTFNNTYDGGVGNLVVTSPNIIINVASPGYFGGSGIITFNGPVTLLQTLTTTLYVSIETNQLTFNGTLNGSGGLSVTGTQPVYFDGTVGGTTPLSSITVAPTSNINTAAVTTSGTQTYSGPVILSGATALISNSGDINAVSITGNALGLSISNAGVNSIVSDITNVSTFTKNGSGTLTLSGTNTYTGDTTINAGTLQYGAANAIPSGTGNGTVIDNGILDVNGFSSTINNLSGSGVVDNVSAGGTPTLTIATNAATSTFSGTIQNTSGILSLQTTGTTGSLILTGGNTYSGTTTISGGTLQVGNGGTTGSLGSGTVIDNSVLEYDLSNTNTLSDTLNGTGNLVQAGSGTLILTGANSYNATTINAGTLQIGNGGTTGSLGTGGVTDNAALNFDLTTSPVIANAISGTGSLTQSGSGTLILTGANSLW